MLKEKELEHVYEPAFVLNGEKYINRNGCHNVTLIFRGRSVTWQVEGQVK